jgi:hypothetical protein
MASSQPIVLSGSTEIGLASAFSISVDIFYFLVLIWYLPTIKLPFNYNRLLPKEQAKYHNELGFNRPRKDKQ